MTLAAVVGRRHQAGVGEQLEVLADGRPGDRASGGQVDDPGRAGGHLVEQRPPDGVGQGGEGVHSQKVTVELLVVEHADVGSVVPAA